MERGRVARSMLEQKKAGGFEDPVAYFVEVQVVGDAYEGWSLPALGVEPDS